MQAIVDTLCKIFYSVTQIILCVYLSGWLKSVYPFMSASAELSGRKLLVKMEKVTIFFKFICCQIMLLHHIVLSGHFSYSTPQVVGQSCVSNHNTTSFAAQSHGYCMWKCLSQKRCFYVNYNTLSGNCYLGFNICAAQATESDMTLNQFYPRKGECMEWVPYTIKPHPVGLVTMLTGKPRQVVARVQYKPGVVVPGKVHPNFKNAFYSSLGSTKIAHSQSQTNTAIEVLAVDMACLQFWVAMEAGSSLPEGAVVAGHLSDGTALYTARFWPRSKLNYGYYNPQTNRAHGEEAGVRSSTTFEVLVVQEPRIH